MKTDADLEGECREKFSHYCRMYADAKFHSEMAHYVGKAYEQIDVYLDLRDVNALWPRPPRTERPRGATEAR